MNADVTSIVIHQAYCHGCRWKGPQRNNEAAADWDADKHDRQHHPLEVDR